MNTGSSYQQYQNKMVTAEHCIQLCTNKLNNLEEMEKFLGTQNLPRINHKETENLKRSVTHEEFESGIKIFPKTNNQNIQGAQKEPLQRKKSKCPKNT
jgi:hypothetical protein